MNIREMRDSDTNEVLEMMRVFYDSPAIIHKANDDTLRRDILACVGDCPFLKGFILEIDGECAGYAMVALGYSTEYGGICLWIEDLYIKPQFRGQKIGTAFFEELEKRYSGYAVRMRLEVESENKRAISLYTSTGFTENVYTVMDKLI